MKQNETGMTASVLKQNPNTWKDLPRYFCVLNKLVFSLFFVVVDILYFGFCYISSDFGRSIKIHIRIQHLFRVHLTLWFYCLKCHISWLPRLPFSDFPRDPRVVTAPSHISLTSTSPSASTHGWFPPILVIFHIHIFSKAVNPFSSAT